MEEIVSEIYNLVKKRMREQGAYDFGAYQELVDEAIDYFLQKGKLSEDDNLQFINEQLLEMWESLENKMGN